MTTVMYEPPGTDLLSDAAVVPASQELVAEHMNERQVYLAHRLGQWRRTYAPTLRAAGREHRPVWLDRVVQRLASLILLEPNWDSYGARPIAPEVAVTALQILVGLADNHTPEPAIYPLPSGGLQVAWELAHMALEVRILSPVRVEVAFESHQTDEESEFVITSDFRRLVELVRELSPDRP